MNEQVKPHFFTLKFDDRNEWNNFKEDLKSILRENEIKYQYSEKVPTFHIVYQSQGIKLRIDWQNDNLFVNLQTSQELTSEIQEACNEIYEILVLFEGKLIDGTSPYEW